MIELRPFHVSDLDACESRDREQVIDGMAIVQQHQGVAFTAVEDGQVIGCAGIVIGWPGVGFAWMCLSDKMNGHGTFLVRTVKNVINDATRALGLHRLEAVCLADSARNQRFLEALGFVREREARARMFYSDGRDVLRYERIGIHY